MRHWANRHKLADKFAQNIEDMHVALQGVVEAVSVAEVNANNLVYKDAFVHVIDTSEHWRQKLAELLMKQGEEARARGNAKEAAKLFEEAIAARGTELCADVKAGRDRVIEMRRVLLQVRGGGEGEGEGEGEGGGDMEEAASSKMELAHDLEGQGKYEEALKLYEEARDMFIKVHHSNHTLAIWNIIFVGVVSAVAVVAMPCASSVLGSGGK